MNIDLKYYHENNNQFISPVEKEIIEKYILNNDKNDYENMLENQQNEEIIMALSVKRQNLFNWYPFKKDASILEIQANFGEVTQVFINNSKNVTLIESNKEKAEAIGKRYQNVKNLKIIVGNLEDINLEGLYDYIIIYNANVLEYAKKYLKSDGTILLATNNRFGIQYFAGANYKGRIYDTILNPPNELYSKNEIENMIKINGFSNYKFYYLLPNYKIPNVIFSDEYLPNENTTKLMYNIMYPKGSVVLFDELKALKQLTKNNQFTFFANSYIVEIKNDKDEEKTNIKFVSYNNNRKEKYQLITIIEKEKVRKEMISEKSKKHIENIKLNTKKLKELKFNVLEEFEGNRVISKFIEQDTFDKIIIKNILEKRLDIAYELIDKWYEYIKQRLLKNKRSELNSNIQYTLEEIEGLNILKNGYIDLVFENTFYKDDEFIFFDQEWYEDGIPLEFLLYRAINNVYSYNLEAQEILKKEELFERYNLSKYIDLFKRIEIFIQKDILDEKMLEINNNSLKQLYDINYMALMQNQIKDFEENDIKQNQYIKNLEEDNQNKQTYIENLERINKELQERIIEIENEKKGKKKFFS